MEVKKINHSFYNNKSNNGLTFNGGVSHKLFKEVINGQQCIGDYFKKTHEVDRINNPYFVLDPPDGEQHDCVSTHGGVIPFQR